MANNAIRIIGTSINFGILDDQDVFEANAYMEGADEDSLTLNKSWIVLDSSTVYKNFVVLGNSFLKATEVDGDLTVKGNISAYSNTFKNLEVTGDSVLNTVSAASLSVSEDSAFNAVEIGGALTVIGASGFTSINVSELSSLKNTEIGGTLSTTGLATLDSVQVTKTLEVTETASLADVTIANTLSVEDFTNLKNSKITGDLEVTGEITGNASSATEFNSDRKLLISGVYVDKEVEAGEEPELIRTESFVESKDGNYEINIAGVKVVDAEHADNADFADQFALEKTLTIKGINNEGVDTQATAVSQDSSYIIDIANVKVNNAKKADYAAASDSTGAVGVYLTYSVTVTRLGLAPTPDFLPNFHWYGASTITALEPLPIVRGSISLPSSSVGLITNLLLQVTKRPLSSCVPTVMPMSSNFSTAIAESLPS